MPRVDRAALKSQLDEYRKHEFWLRDPLDPAWARSLERRWRRRELAGLIFYTLFLAAMLIDGAAVFITEAAAGTLSIWLTAIALCLGAFLLWLFKGLLIEVVQLSKPLLSATGREPPEEPEARLQWLERQAELAYAAMYDAAPGSALAARYNDAKEFLYDAIALANRLGHAATAERLSERLAEIKTVFRTQFPA